MRLLPRDKVGRSLGVSRLYLHSATVSRRHSDQRTQGPPHSQGLQGLAQVGEPKEAGTNEGSFPAESEVGVRERLEAGERGRLEWAQCIMYLYEIVCLCLDI